MNTKGKGSGYERAVCRMLSKWIQGTEDPVLIWRSSNSGGTFTINTKIKGIAAKAMSGDLCSIDEKSKWLFDKFSVECKCGYSKANPLKLFKFTKNDELESFWNQATTDASRSSKNPILIFKQNQGKSIIGFTKEITEKLNIIEKLNYPILRIIFNNKLPELCCFSADKFFEFYNINEFKEKCLAL